MYQKKILFISNISGEKIGSFSLASIHAAHDVGLEFHIAANFDRASMEQREKDEIEHGIKIHHIDFIRNPMHPGNIKAYRQLVELIKREKFDIIHCNTPIGGLCGRLAGKKCGVHEVIYQAHGFHFYKGAPKKNWLIYYPIERMLAHYTDALITINQEDYKAAKRFRLRKNGKVYYVPGVGIDLSVFQVIQKDKLRQSLEIKPDDIMLISAGDLVERKNYKVAIRAVKEARLQNLKYCICGKGPQMDDLKQYAKDLGIEKQIIFLGFCSNIKELYQAADIFLFTTRQEGMPRSMMEAMASGLPCIASKIRGNTDLISDGNGGYLLDAMDSKGFSKAICTLAEDASLRKKFAQDNLNTIKQFDINFVSDDVKDVYLAEIGGYSPR